jgi:hypothetical protein
MDHQQFLDTAERLLRSKRKERDTELEECQKRCKTLEDLVQRYRDLVEAVLPSSDDPKDDDPKDDDPKDDDPKDAPSDTVSTGPKIKRGSSVKEKYIYDTIIRLFELHPQRDTIHDGEVLNGGGHIFNTKRPVIQQSDIDAYFRKTTDIKEDDACIPIRANASGGWLIHMPAWLRSKLTVK